MHAQFANKKKNLQQLHTALYSMHVENVAKSYSTPSLIPVLFLATTQPPPAMQCNATHRERESERECIIDPSRVRFVQERAVNIEFVSDNCNNYISATLTVIAATREGGFCGVVGHFFL